MIDDILEDMEACGLDESFRQTVMSNLEGFVEQKPALDPNMYGGDAKAYGQDYREHCLKPLHHSRKLLEYTNMLEIDAYEIMRASDMAFSGRLDIHPDGSIEYTAGQLAAVEYRHAVCAVLATAIRNHYINKWKAEDEELDGLNDKLREIIRARLSTRIWRNYFM